MHCVYVLDMKKKGDNTAVLSCGLLDAVRVVDSGLSIIFHCIGNVCISVVVGYCRHRWCEGQVCRPSGISQGASYIGKGMFLLTFVWIFW